MIKLEANKKGELLTVIISTERKGSQEDEKFLQTGKSLLSSLHPGRPGNFTFSEPEEGQQGNTCFCECKIICEDPEIMKEIERKMDEAVI